MEDQLENSEEKVQIIESWHEVSLDSVSARTQMGQAIKLGLQHGWVVKCARTVSETLPWKRKNGKIVDGKREENLWVGGAKPSFSEPEKFFLINRFYIKTNNGHCDFPTLKRFILEN